MGKYLLYFFFVFSVPAQAGFLDDLKVKARPILVKLLGKEKASQILGPGPSTITLPKIPSVQKDAKSIDGYGAEARVKVDYPEDKVKQYNYSFVQDIFMAVRRYKAENQDIAKWMNVLGQNGSREGVYRALVLDGAYLGLENHNFPMQNQTVTFTNDFLTRYLNKSINPENLKKANFFTVKRDVTEKTLEIVDELFKQSGDEIYDWYAVFSAEMAKSYPKAMDNKVRKQTEAMYHKTWAKSVPDQYLKSEIIIKLHKVFNTIQG